MSTASSGRAREYRVRDDLRAHQWVPVMRSAASKGVADLALVHPIRGLALVQVGTFRSKRLAPDQRVAFLGIAEMCGALPILATVRQGVGITYWHVGPGPASTWEPWQP